MSKEDWVIQKCLSVYNVLFFWISTRWKKKRKKEKKEKKGYSKQNGKSIKKDKKDGLTFE